MIKVIFGIMVFFTVIFGCGSLTDKNNEYRKMYVYSAIFAVISAIADSIVALFV